MTGDARRRLGAALLVAWLLVVGGCGDEEPPKATQIKNLADPRITAVEDAIKWKQYSLPARVKGLIRHLRELRQDVVAGESGREPRNADEAVAALDAVIARLEAWHKASPRQGDTDEDRARLQVIVAEAKEVLSGLKAGEQKAR